MSYHIVVKEFRDFADDIEAVNINFLCAPAGMEADWQSSRVTRFMPVVESRLRRYILRLPIQVVDSRSGLSTSRYALHHYFEIFRAGNREYSQVYTEIIDTKAEKAAADPALAERPESRISRELR